MALETCGFCDKKGVLLYPVRYAVACPAGASLAPGLRAPFRIEHAPADIASAKFTLRAVRTGYLYTYDEKRDRLKAYLVMPGGHLWNFPTDLPAPSPQGKEFVCTSPVEAALSMCVDVAHSDSDPAQLFWMGWANSAWTPALIRRVRDQAWRSKHMRSVNIQRMVGGQATAHAGEFEKSHAAVAHFSMNVRDMQKAFGFSNTPITHEMWRTKMAPKFLRTFARRAPVKTGYIFALDDPVGITNDLSELTVPSAHSGFDTALYRGRIIDDILQSIESAVRERARNDFDFDMKQMVIDHENRPAEGITYTDARELWQVIKAGGPAKLAQQRAAERKKYGAAHGGRRKAAEDEAWAALTTQGGKPILDAQQRAVLPARYNAAVQAFEQQGAALAQAHVNWLTSQQLLRWMACMTATTLPAASPTANRWRSASAKPPRPRPATSSLPHG